MIKAEDLRDETYYCAAHQGSLDLTHPAMKRLVEEAETSKSIIDLGCGEGTRLSLIAKRMKNIKKSVGVDNNELAIKKARKQYRDIKFIKANLEKIPLNDESFELAYSAYVFEHLTNVEQVIKEAYRILKKNGKLVVVAPNFGSPNRRSPNSIEGKIVKLLRGILMDFKAKKASSLNWTKVEPKKNKYTIDADTTLEPYLGSLLSFAEYLDFKILHFSSCWSEDRFAFFQLPFRVLAFLGIHPFTLWGPHLLVVLQKKHE